MTPELIGEAAVCGLIFAGLLLVFLVGSVVADYIFPRIPYIREYLDSLPEYEEDQDEGKENW